MLDNLFLYKRVSSSYTNSHHCRIFSAEHPHALHEIHFIYLKFVFSAQCLEKKMCAIVLWRHNYCKKLPRYFIQSTNWLEKVKRYAGFNKKGRPTIMRAQQHLSCKTSAVIALSGTALGHHDHQTLCHLTFMGGFLNKESSTLIQEVWQISNIKLKGH